MNMIYIDLKRIKEAAAINYCLSYCHYLALYYNDNVEIKEKRHGNANHSKLTQYPSQLRSNKAHITGSAMLKCLNIQFSFKLYLKNFLRRSLAAQIHLGCSVQEIFLHVLILRSCYLRFLKKRQVTQQETAVPFTFLFFCEHDVFHCCKTVQQQLHYVTAVMQTCFT